MSNTAAVLDSAGAMSPAVASSIRARIRWRTGVAACAFLAGLVASVHYFRATRDNGAPLILPEPHKVLPAADYAANDDVDVARLTGEAGPAVIKATPLTTRFVKSIAVRPDGSTIESSEVAALEARAGRDITGSRTPVKTATAPSAPVASTTPAVEAPATPAPAAVVTAAAPPPRVERHDAVAATPESAASTIIAKSSAPIAVQTAAGAGRFYAQLAASPSEEEAAQLAQKLQLKLGGALARRDLLIQSGAVKDKTFYRIRVSALSREDAAALCASLRGLNACFVAKD